MTRFLVSLGVMVLLTVIRTTDSRERFRGPILFLFDALCSAYAEDQEFRAVANRAFNTPKVS